jgi:general secretion pathway protein L
MSRKVLGLEIREASVAAVLLESGFKGSVLEAQGFFPIPADAPGDEGLKETLKTIVETLKPAGAACVLGIPATAVSFRNLSLPFHDPKKIRQILPFELEPSLPLPVDELAFDFDAVRRDGHHDLLAFTVEKTRIQGYLDLLLSVNLRPVVIVPGGYAAARFAASLSPDGGDLLFIDTGEGHHTVFALAGGHVRMVRSLPVAGSGSPVVRHLEASLERTLTASRESLGITIAPASVVSIGPQAELLPAAGEGDGILGLPVRTLADIRSFSRLRGRMDSPEWSSGQLDTALALALTETESLGGINFSTERSTVQHYWSEYRSQIILTAVLLVITLTTALAGQIVSIRAKQRRLAELDQAIEAVFKRTFPGVTRIQAPLQQMQLKIKAAGEAGMGPELPGSRVRVIDILNALSQNIPKSLDVDVNRMVVGGDNVVLSGTTDNFNTVNDIKGRLESADIFKSVTISSADLEKSGQRVRFKLKLDF